MVKKYTFLMAAASMALLTFGATEDSTVVESVEKVEKKKETQLIYDEHHIIQLGDHNHQEFFDMAKDLQNSTTVVLIYARK